MHRHYRVLVIPAAPGEVTFFQDGADNTLSELIGNGCNTIETFPLVTELLERNLIGICDEDGMRNDQGLNWNVRPLVSPMVPNYLLGTVLIAKRRGVNFVSLTDDDYQAIRDVVGRWHPQRISIIAEKNEAPEDATKWIRTLLDSR